MESYHGLKIGDRLKRNAYPVRHFRVGGEYEIETFVDGYPRVYGDRGEMVTITSQYNPKYWDLLRAPNPAQLRAGDLIKFTKDYFNLGTEKEFIVNRAENDGMPYVYGKNGRATYLKHGSYFYKVVGSLKQNLSLAHQIKPGDRLTRLVPGGKYHEKGFNYTVGRVQDGVVWVHTEQGYIRPIKASSEKNWKKYEPQIRSITVHETGPRPNQRKTLDQLVNEMAIVIDRSLAIRLEIKQTFLDLGLDDELADKASEQVIVKGLSRK